MQHDRMVDRAMKMLDYQDYDYVSSLIEGAEMVWKVSKDVAEFRKNLPDHLLNYFENHRYGQPTDWEIEQIGKLFQECRETYPKYVDLSKRELSLLVCQKLGKKKSKNPVVTAEETMKMLDKVRWSDTIQLMDFDRTLTHSERLQRAIWIAFLNQEGE